jgi:hypothetical protein
MREPLGNVTLIERPLRTITLISSVRAAIRARQKQYDIRNHLEKLRQADEALRRSNERLEGQVTERTSCASFPPALYVLRMKSEGVLRASCTTALANTSQAWRWSFTN